MEEHSVALVADDHEMFRAALAALLRRDLGFGEVIEAGSLDEALAHLRGSSHVTFASFDLAMPGVESVATLQDVRAEFPGVQLAIISASERRDDILRALTIGIHGFIPKTLRIAEITRALRIVLEGQVFVPASLSEVIVSPPVQPATVDVAAPNALNGALSPRQRQVLTLIRQGKSNKEIARALGLAEGTVKVHVNALFRALGVTNRVQAAGSHRAAGGGE